MGEVCAPTCDEKMKTRPAMNWPVFLLECAHLHRQAQSQDAVFALAARHLER